MRRILSLILVLVLILGTGSCKFNDPSQAPDDVGGKKPAVIFPGAGYNKDRPLLYYSREILDKEGYEILDIEWEDDSKTREILDDVMKITSDYVKQ